MENGQGPPFGTGNGKDRTPAEVAIWPGVVISSALCAYIEEAQAVIVADIHLGMEAAAETDGAFFPRRQKPVLMRRLGRILDRFRPRLMVIAGDFKHNFGQDRRREMDEVREVFDYLDSRTQVALTKGNHDNYLKNILPREPVPRWTRAGHCFVCHGHQDLPELGRFKGLKVLGHEHPALKLRDAVGAVVSAPAFVYDEADRTLVLPALGPLAFGTDVLRVGTGSPHLRELDRRRWRIFAATGTGMMDFGAVENIRAAMGQHG